MSFIFNNIVFLLLIAPRARFRKPPEAEVGEGGLRNVAIPGPFRVLKTNGLGAAERAVFANRQISLQGIPVCEAIFRPQRVVSEGVTNSDPVFWRQKTRCTASVCETFGPSAERPQTLSPLRVENTFPKRLFPCSV
jgi:hypothetical protein